MLLQLFGEAIGRPPSAAPLPRSHANQGQAGDRTATAPPLI